MQIETSHSSIKLADSSGIVQAKHIIHLPHVPEETRSLLAEADTDPKLISKINFTDRGGTILTNVQVQLIFWGREWDSNPPPSPTASDITKAIATILSSSYMSELSQHRSRKPTSRRLTQAPSCVLQVWEEYDAPLGAVKVSSPLFN